MSERSKTVDLLRQIRLFGVLTLQERLSLSRITVQRKKRKHTTVYEENESAEAVYGIVSGLVKTLRKDSPDRIGFFATGDFLPGVWPQRGARYEETAETISQTALVKIPIAEFAAWLERNPAAAAKISRAYERAIMGTQETADAESRGRAFLLQLADHCGRVTGGKVRVGIPMTNQSFALTIGTTKENGELLLREWHERGIADMGRSGFVIHDVEALKMTK
ncbi:Crp/Fnr family transcriptional regulator [Cohnella candidum]|uniref:Crp/Fnr family transcriptional regulator n=1 Tax=Cohnella candidum TaxID=2674991 RepID=A0A3G3JXR5_9BACL|nr:Crp/Fnr family transcriptional regulator [Cohnella candidum]AYQ72309.1 Crp/Fnr family transcriptional regulator [Cohnella candidum]